MTGNNGVAAVEACLLVEEMHGAATPTATAFLLAIEFGHDRFGRNAPGQGLSMLAIGGHEVVFRRQRLNTPTPTASSPL